jgi:hypothetical protein
MVPEAPELLMVTDELADIPASAVLFSSAKFQCTKVVRDAEIEVKLKLLLVAGVREPEEATKVAPVCALVPCRLAKVATPLTGVAVFPVRVPQPVPMLSVTAVL